MRVSVTGLLRARLFSPKGFLIRAAVLFLLFLALHAFGLRDSTSIVCGTAPAAGGAAALFFATAYIVTYICATVAAPAMAIAAAIFAAILWVSRRSAR
jgi:hypothetical protein